MKIDAKTKAVVTGGASGLGAAVVDMLMARNAAVTVFDLAIVDGDASYAQVDVTDPDDVAEAMRAAHSRMGGLTVLVNCAGIAPGAKTTGRSGPHDPALFAKTIAVNLVGSHSCACQAATLMADNAPNGSDGARGVILHTASIAAWEGQVGQTAYAASKGGVVGMTLPMARDLAPLGIRVNAIAPGLFMTPMMSGLPDEVQSSLGAQVPYPNRLGKPEEFASLAAHIIENPMMNGETIRLDGAIRLPPR